MVWNFFSEVNEFIKPRLLVRCKLVIRLEID